MWEIILSVIIGYLSGSVLYANVFGRLFNCADKFNDCKDQNPGTANAFLTGGFWCGMLTLLGDLFKGVIPVFVYTHYVSEQPPLGISLVLAAPVIGHIFPLFYRFKGGKGIATTFGCLFGLIGDLRAFIVMAVFFILFSVVLRITPHFHRTVASFVCTAITVFIIGVDVYVCLGILIITAGVLFKMFSSKELREKMQVRLLWMR